MTEEQGPARLAEDYVAFLDLLGFSNLVALDDFDTKVGSYFAVVRESIAAHPPDAEFTIASDSTILTTTGTSLEHLRALLSTVATITYRSLVELGLPIRGGIAFGSFRRQEVENAGTLVAGRSVVAAYELEQSQEWIGVTLAPHIISQNPELQAYFSLTTIGAELLADECREAGHHNWILLAMQYYAVPADDRLDLEGDRRKLDGYVVVPHIRAEFPDREAIVRQLRRYKDRLEELRPGAPNGRAQSKYSNSLEFIQTAKTRFDTVSRHHSELQPYWQRFVHGA